MCLDPAWVSAIFGFVGVMFGLAGSVIRDLITYRREDERRVREERQRWLESRKIAYYRFIDVFSTHVDRENIHDYFRASLEASEYGNVILSTPLKAKPYPIGFVICSLKDLREGLTFKKSTYAGDANRPASDEYMKGLEGLRSEALTPFLNEFMDRLEQSEYHMADKVEEIKKNKWWHVW